MDFRQATKLFADPEFDGPPISSIDKSQDEEMDVLEEDDIEDIDTVRDSPDDDYEIIEGDDRVIDEDTPRPKRFYVNGVDVQVINETVKYYDEDGKLTTKSLRSYTKDNITDKYKTLGEFLTDWNDSERKSAIIKELEERGVFFEELKKEVGKDLDPFDMVLHIAFDKPPLTRQERANNVLKEDYFSKYGEEARRVLKVLLEKYSDEGIEAIEDLDVLKVQPLNQFGSPFEIISYFGGRKQYVEAVQQMQEIIYVGANYGTQQSY